MELIFI